MKKELESVKKLRSEMRKDMLEKLSYFSDEDYTKYNNKELALLIMEIEKTDEINVKLI